MLLARTALALSYVWELLALPFHSGRLAALRLASQRAGYELALGLDQELIALRRALHVIQQMEREVEEIDLTLSASRQLAVKSLAIVLARLQQRLADSLDPDKATDRTVGERNHD